jgi:hypothetical protein
MKLQKTLDKLDRMEQEVKNNFDNKLEQLEQDNLHFKREFATQQATYDDLSGRLNAIVLEFDQR